MSVQELTTTTVILPTLTPSTVFQTTSSLEELTPTSSLVIENEIAVETTFLTDQTDDKEKSEIETKKEIVSMRMKIAKKSYRVIGAAMKQYQLWNKF